MPDGRLKVEVRNPIREGDALEVLSPNALGLTLVARNLTDETGSPLAAATVPMTLAEMDGAPGVESGDLLRLRTQKE